MIMGMEREHTTRNYGIDVLKLLSMLMVVILHILGQGRILDSVEFLSINYGAAWLVEIAALCAVNCYAIISGYVSVGSKTKYSNLATLWLQVILYNIVITLLMIASRDDLSGGLFTYMKMFFPVITKQYWYFTAYFALFFVMPCYNCVIENMDQKQLRRVLVVLIVLFSIIPTMINRDIYEVSKGYGFLWLSLLYMLGGYFKKYNIIQKISSKRWTWIYLVSVVITFLEKYLCEGLFYYMTREVVYHARLCYYTSPTVLLCAISLLGVFSQIKFQKKRIKIISVLSASSFGVYLIHAHPLVYDYILNDRYIWVANLSTFRMIMVALIAAFSIFIVCLGIDLVRAQIFLKLGLKDFLTYWESRLLEGKKDDKDTKS